ncbi:MAG: D-tyrosyl-tRNA(Tyr) deacylase [Spirochaetae bacterium HGW-Spirochaetae-6]|nr:MAG: D-tyrosyl-tRNA(Tyr) deacylase [Spirochaetae bacterium HGW-Spirochaetae-6]
MKAVIQRVSEASVVVNKKQISGIDRGLLVLLGLEEGDGPVDLDYMIKKILGLRIFPNEQGLFDLSVRDVEGELLVVSQFTLLANCKKGNRPSFSSAMPVADARVFFQQVEKEFLQAYPRVRFGKFQEDMRVNLCNDGPVTLILESPGKG